MSALSQRSPGVFRALAPLSALLEVLEWPVSGWKVRHEEVFSQRPSAYRLFLGAPCLAAPVATGGGRCSLTPLGVQQLQLESFHSPSLCCIYLTPSGLSPTPHPPAAFPWASSCGPATPNSLWLPRLLRNSIFTHAVLTSAPLANFCSLFKSQLKPHVCKVSRDALRDVYLLKSPHSSHPADRPGHLPPSDCGFLQGGRGLVSSIGATPEYGGPGDGRQHWLCVGYLSSPLTGWPALPWGCWRSLALAFR